MSQRPGFALAHGYIKYESMRIIEISFLYVDIRNCVC